MIIHKKNENLRFEYEELDQSQLFSLLQDDKKEDSIYFGIWCDTIELAEQICYIFDFLGIQWCTKTSYKESNEWYIHEESTVYYPKSGTFSDLSHAVDSKIKLFKFEPTFNQTSKVSRNISRFIKILQLNNENLVNNLNTWLKTQNL